MLERFTRDARTAVHLAATGDDRHDGRVDSVSLLLALAWIDTGADGVGAGGSLRAAGLDRPRLEAAARTVERPDLASDDVSTDPDVSSTPAAPASDAPDLDVAALAALGIDLDAIRARADEVFGPGALDLPSRGEERRGRRRRARFTPDAKKVLELAVREAVRRHDRTITSSDLLRGLLRDEDSPAVRTLRAADADVAALRAAADDARPGHAA